MTLLNVDVESANGRARIAVSGELDISSAGRLEEELASAQAQSPELLILDLRELEFMDSTGLRLIVRADEAAKAGGTRFVIVRGPDPVQRVFQLVGLDSRLDMADEPPAG